MKLTDLEGKIMRAVWSLGNKATVNEILDNWGERQVPGYTTVLKTLQLMEQKGIVGHRKKGRAYRYYGKIDKKKPFLHQFRSLVNTFFDGDRLSLANTLISEDHFTEAELNELRKMIDRKRKGAGNG